MIGEGLGKLGKHFSEFLLQIQLQYRHIYALVHGPRPLQYSQ